MQVACSFGSALYSTTILLGFVHQVDLMYGIDRSSHLFIILIGL
jgi:hypothetical protein